MDENTQENATGTATSAKPLGDVLRDEVTELRAHFDAIGDAYAAGRGPAAVSDEIEKGKDRLSKLDHIVDQLDALDEKLEATDEVEELATPAETTE